MLDKYVYKDINDIIKQYLCYFKKCSKCNKETSAKYDMRLGLLSKMLRDAERVCVFVYDLLIIIASFWIKW